MVLHKLSALMKTLSRLIALLGMVSAVYAQSPVRVEVSTDRDTISIGETITYTVKVIHDPSWKIAGDPVTDFSQFEVMQIRKLQPEMRGTQMEDRTEYLLTTFNVDTFLISAPKVYLISGKDSLLASGTPRLIFVMSSLDPSVKDIRPEKPLIRGQINWWLLGLLALLAVLVIAGLVFLVWRLYRRRQRKRLEPVSVPVNLRSPEEVALEKLDILQQEGLPQQGMFKAYHSMVSEIVRSYIEDKFGVPAMESTTSDLVRSLRERRTIHEAFLSMTRRFLEVCDLVKFAKYVPALQECDEVMQLARTLIQFHSTSVPAPEKV